MFGRLHGFKRKLERRGHVQCIVVQCIAVKGIWVNMLHSSWHSICAVFMATANLDFPSNRDMK